MAVVIQAARQFTYPVARLMAKGEGTLEASMVKAYVCRAAEWVTREAMQIHGGMGYAEEFPVSRYFVDARVLSIFEGADETLCLKVIARRLVEPRTGLAGGWDRSDEPLEAFPDDWSSALAVMAHPDDLEYGGAAAVAAWTRAGQQVTYLLATRGEAGIDGMAPAEAAALREGEQRASAAIVGVDDVEFLDHPDGMLHYGLRRCAATSPPPSAVTGPRWW